MKLRRSLRRMLVVVTLVLSGGVLRANGPSLSWQMPKTVRMDGGMIVSDVRAGTPAAGQMNCATAKVDPAPLAGHTVRLSVRVRGEDVVGESGLKFMLSWTDDATGVTTYPEPYYPGKVRPTGTFGWTNLVFTVSWRGTTVRGATLYLGLQRASGRVFFDLSSLKVSTCEDVFPYVNENLICPYDDLVARRPVLRGAMSSAPLRVTEDDIRTLASWGGRLYRYQMHASLSQFRARHPGFDLPDRDAPREAWRRFDRLWLDEALDHLVTNVLPWARQYGLMVVVDMHQVPGGFFKAFGAQSVFGRPEFAEDFFDAWRHAATRLKGNHDVIYGYDLMNEPQQQHPGKWSYWTLQERAAREIRTIDPVTPIVFAANEASSPEAFRYLSPIDLTNVIYQVHFYRDNAYTHGRWASAEAARTYPDGAFNKDYLRRLMVHVRRFQQKHKARIFCGEFSACGWAPGADRWIADVIDIMEDYGWDWTFHAFREAPMWSVEHVYDGMFRGAKAVPSSDNPRMRALKEGLKRGLKPAEPTRDRRVSSVTPGSTWFRSDRKELQ